jgi:hypothetical protein
MRFSAFSRFGFLRFSSRPPISQTIYEGLREGLGGNAVLGDDSFDGPLAAKLFATSMVIGAAQRSIDHVNAEARPSTSTELIADHEKDYWITPPTMATLAERRAALAEAELIAQGNSASVVNAALEALLGDRLIAIRHFGEGEAVASPSDWDTIGPGLWKPAGSIGKTHRLATTVGSGTSPFSLTLIDGDPIIGGEEAIIDPGKLGIEERIVTADTIGQLFATFARPHEAGALISTKPWPRVTSTARHLLIVVDSDTAVSARWRRAVAKLLKKILKSTERWSLVAEASPGTLGPFVPGSGIPGVTPLTETTTSTP